MEDAHEREARYGQRGAISFNAPLVEKTYYFVGFDHEEGAVYYLFKNQYYRCTAYLGSMEHELVDEDKVKAVSAGSTKWFHLDDRQAYTQEEVSRIIQHYLAKDIAGWKPSPKQEKGWFKSLLEAIFE
jgi:hypothetical protein